MSIQSNQPDSIKKLAKLINGIEIAMLTTEDQDGCLHSRPMATQKKDFDGSLWFFCREDSAKAAEITAHKRVNLSYASPGYDRYVSVTGTAEVVKDRAKIAEFWNLQYTAWFPDGQKDPQLVLIRVNVESAQYWDLPHNPAIHLKGFLNAVKSGKFYGPKDSGESEKIKIA
jgi:general stress protein 26